MKESFKNFEIEKDSTAPRGGFARGALFALPISLALWAVLFFLL